MFSRKKKYQQMSDEHLMPLIAQGQEEAFNVLYSRYHEKLYRYFYRMLYQDEALAADQVQELFLKVIQKANLFKDNKNCSTWLYTIAANICKNEYRRAERYQKRIKTWSELPTEDALTADEKIDKGIYDKALEKAIDELQEPHRQCFILRFQEELPIKEIARILDCPEGTIKSRLYHSTKKISAKLQFLHLENQEDNG